MTEHVPWGSNVTHAELELRVIEARNGGGLIRVYETFGGTGASWEPGNANAAGDECIGTTC